CIVVCMVVYVVFFFFFQAEDGIRDYKVTGVQTCALPISFKIFGAKKVYILDGGLPKWKAEGRPVDFGPAQRTPKKFDSELNTRRSEERRVGKECRSRGSPYQ